MSLLPNHKRVSSSNIVSVAYDPADQTLEVVFKNGSVYQYAGVPKHIADHLMAASSVGSYFHSTIKGYYQTTRMPDAPQ